MRPGPITSSCSPSESGERGTVVISVVDGEEVRERGGRGWFLREANRLEVLKKTGEISGFYIELVDLEEGQLDERSDICA